MKLSSQIFRQKLCIHFLLHSIIYNFNSHWTGYIVKCYNGKISYNAAISYSNDVVICQRVSHKGAHCREGNPRRRTAKGASVAFRRRPTRPSSFPCARADIMSPTCHEHAGCTQLVQVADRGMLNTADVPHVYL